MMRFIERHKTELIVFFLAILARMAFFFVCLYANGGNVENTIHGQDGYFDISRNLLLGNGFSINQTPPFSPYSYGVPGYPFFLFFLLWATGSYAATAMIQLVLGAFIPVLGMYLSRLIVPTYDRAPLAVGILLALAPYQILFSFIFYTEVLFTALFGIFLILFLNFLKTPSIRFAVLAGLFLGLATLTKPTVQYLAILAVVFAWWRLRSEVPRDILLKAGCFFLLFLTVLSPWVYRNYRTFNMINLGSQMPFNLYEVLLPSVLAIENQTSFAAEQQKLPVQSADLYVNAPRSISRMAITEISRHPVALVKLSALNAVTFFTHDGMLTFLQAAGVQRGAYIGKPALVLFLTAPLSFLKIARLYMHTIMASVFLGRLFWIAVTVLFGSGLYHLWRSGLFSAQVLFCMIVVVYFMLTTMINGLTVNARFRMPVEPIIFGVAYAGYFSIRHFRKNLKIDGNIHV
ncbi:MAG: glycosyltransferase family 39 protein [Candidatus Sungbacteria bacterium]|nr:glycosyltransferase family 39 protein [Candidatus Sungbacteria bacterium]